jgi:glutamate dehydrogenase
MTRGIDRIEEFVGAVDHYEPLRASQHEDDFRIFARFLSRSLDARYLERHPAQELIPDLEELFCNGLHRQPEEIKIQVTVQGVSEDKRAYVSLCMPDATFIVSTVLLSLEQMKVSRTRYLANVVPVERGASGELSAISATHTLTESFMWIELDPRSITISAEEIKQGLKMRLETMCQIVDDFTNFRAVMTQLCDQMSTLISQGPEHDEVHLENIRFLNWLLSDNFVFLGLRYLPDREVTPQSSIDNLGMGRFDDWRGVDVEAVNEAIRKRGALNSWVKVRKSTNESYIYRQGRLDQIVMQCWNKAGQECGVLVIEGLFSHEALAQAKTMIPKLDQRLNDVFSALNAKRGTHKYRTIRNAFNSVPLEYLFTLKFEVVLDIVQRFLSNDAEQGFHVYITQDDIEKFSFVFVAVPGSHYSDELRSDIRSLLQSKFSATSIDGGVFVSDSSTVTCHYFINGASLLDTQTQEGLRDDIEELTKPWLSRLLDALNDTHGVQEGRRLHQRYGEAFSSRYKGETSVTRAVADLNLLENLASKRGFDCDLYQEKDDRTVGITRLRMVYAQGVLLSEILPVLDHFGLIVVDEYPTTVQIPGEKELTIITFRIRGAKDMDVQLMSRRNRLKDAIKAVVIGAIDNHAFNSLLLKADLPWSYVALLRAYQMYFAQIGSPYSTSQMHDALTREPAAVRSLTEVFRAQFDPGVEGLSAYDVDEKRVSLKERARRAFLSLLDGVQELLTDQILRSFYNLIEATVRTNFYARDPLSFPAIALKFDSKVIQRIPSPAPYREIYVHHPKMAGLHLRTGPVARGGIRWSDRPLDFRSELLGLMATQDLKNVVIVPKGAKGSFVLRDESKDSQIRRQEADYYYRIFIESLLSVTDNLKDDEVVHPGGVISYDGDDPYLVVAADKGTAHLSDTANEVAESLSFWLGDAFASGGSRGYDHKKEGITAKGAWESVKRHFREIDMDPEKDPIRIVGIGDMSGDVFGNGLLRSKTAQLVAAFDHRHIFIDPHPDPSKSFSVRQELFLKPRSSWTDYPKEHLSAGAGIYPRSAKQISLSPEAQEVLGISDESLSGNSLIRAILCAPIDLLWNGGIGTYIKAATETHLDIGDATNDDVRVDANMVRTKVVGEGGNLGLSPLARVELAANGVHLNTDAIDNSAGVDLSDHEVNLKILFQPLLSRQTLELEERDRIMEHIRPQVNVQVLHNNWVHSRMVSLDGIRSQRDLHRFARAIHFLAERVPFNRREQYLPGQRVLTQRQTSGLGLYRPELASLTAFAKQHLRQELAQMNEFDQEKLSEHLSSYFPKYIVERFYDATRAHPLGRHIAQAVFTNTLIADAGCTLLSEAKVLLGSPTIDFLNAYTQAISLLDAPELKGRVAQIESELSATQEYSIRLLIEDSVETMAYWFLSTGNIPKGFATSFAAVRSEASGLLENINLSDQAQSTFSNLPSALRQHLEPLVVIRDLIDIAMLASTMQLQSSKAQNILKNVSQQANLNLVIDKISKPEGIAAQDRCAWYILMQNIRHTRVQLASRSYELSEIGKTDNDFFNTLSQGLAEHLDRPPSLGQMVLLDNLLTRSLRSLDSQ